MPAVSGFSRAKGSQIFKSKARQNGNVKKKRPSVTDKEICSNQPPKLKAARRRRAAICFVMEEEDRRHGTSLAELRRELIVRYLLINVGLL